MDVFVSAVVGVIALNVKASLPGSDNIARFQGNVVAFFVAIVCRRSIAKSGQLAIWVGGEEAILAAHKRVLDAFSDAARYIGPDWRRLGGQARTQLRRRRHSSGSGRGLLDGDQGRIEPLALWEAVRTGASARSTGFYDRFLPNKYDPPSFALR